MLLLIFTSFIICLTYLWHQRKFIQLSLKLPGPLAYPIIGNGFYFFCHNHDIFDKMVALVAKFPSPFRVWLGPKLVVIISDAEQAAKILSSSNFSHKDAIYRFIKIFNGEGLISGSGAKWKRDRKLMAPLFTKRKAEEYFPIVSKHVGVLLDKLQNKIGGSSFNVETYLHRCCADFVNEAILGVRTNAQNGKEFDPFLKAVDRMYALVHARMVKIWLQIEWIFKLTHYYQEQESGKREIHGFLRKVIQEKVLSRSSDSLLDKIIGLIQEFTSETEIVHHMCTLYTASEDTITTITAFSLLLMGMHPEIQEKASNEIKTVLGDRDAPDFDDLDRLPFTEMCIKEVLRLFPIAPFILRTTTNDFKLDKWTIPQGCTVTVSIHNIHRNPKYWKHPNSFYPEHFANSNRPVFAYLPFSAGPRGCLGKTFAYMALKTLLVSILYKYRIEADGTLDDIPLKADISVRAKNGQYPIRIRSNK